MRMKKNQPIMMRFGDYYQKCETMHKEMSMSDTCKTAIVIQIVFNCEFTYNLYLKR